MAWIRLDDNYVYHPKFALLSSQAFRLWHEGMCYCRKLMTDGLIRSTDLKAFLYATPKAISELTTVRGQSAPLWIQEPGGYRVHDYLDWNPSQAEEQRDRDATKQRVRAYRAKWREPPSNGPGNAVRNASCNALVRGEGQGQKAFTERESERKPSGDALGARAGQLLEHYAGWYAKYRRGAKLRLLHNALEFQDACELCELWDDAHLEKLAQIVLTTDDEFISKTDRSFRLFALKATWADDRLKAAENGAV